MSKKENFSTSIIKILHQLIRLSSILWAQRRSENNPGYSQIIKKIRELAQAEGVDPDLVVKVARCESALDNKAMRMNKSGSIDRGLFQWNDYWHPEISNKCAFSIECSTKSFCKAVKEGHISWWNSSKHCWGPS